MGCLDKVIRKPIYQQSNMNGMVKDYKKIYDEIKNWNNIDDNENDNKLKGVIYGMGYAVGDAGYFGWKSNELTNERNTFNAVYNAYMELLHACEDALGIESKVYVSRVDEDGYYKKQ
jgi:hypothetical protein